MKFVPGASEPAVAALSVSHDGALVALSVVIAGAASYVTILLAGSLREAAEPLGRRTARGLLLAAAASLGAGIWATHVVGALSLRLPTEIGFAWGATALSLAVAVFLSGVGVRIVLHGATGVRIAAAGAVTGLGACAANALGLAALEVPAEIWFRTDRWVLTVVAVVALASLAFAGVTEPASTERGRRVHRLGATALVALTLLAAHYGGRWGTVLVPSPVPVGTRFTLDANLMASSVAAMMFLLVGLGLLAAGSARGVTPRFRLGLLGLLLATVAVGVGTVTLAVLYDAAFRERQERLVEAGRRQARFLEALAEVAAARAGPGTAGGGLPPDPRVIGAARSRIGDADSTVEINIGRRRGDRIEFYLGSATLLRAACAPVTECRTPMERALRGESGTMIVLDRRGRRVLAAYEPTAIPGIGVVAALRLSEIRAPFLRAGIGAGVGALLLSVLAIALGRGIGNPMLRQLDEKQRIEHELELARSIQAGLLPDELPTVPGFAFAARAVPARFVGGDFYDFARTGDGRIAIIAGDVSGKGVGAAIYMSRLLGDFRYAMLSSSEPEQVIAAMNEALCRDSRRGMFATAIHLLLDPETRRLRMVNAGHHPAALRRARGAVVEVGAASGPPLGVVPGAAYEATEVRLAPGERMLLYTDGAVEARDEAGREFGLPRLFRILAGHAGAARGLVLDIEEALDAHSGGRDRHDDLTLVVLESSPDP